MSPVIKEILNIAAHDRVWPGDTLSHATADECVQRGWAKRDEEGWFRATRLGRAISWAAKKLKHGEGIITQDPNVTTACEALVRFGLAQLAHNDDATRKTRAFVPPHTQRTR